MPRMLFHRNFQGFTGGHLKFWDYFNHVEASEGWQAEIYFSPDSVWSTENPWRESRAQVLPIWEPARADALFLGGHDWRMLSASERDRYAKPIFNLIQHVHHGDPAHPLSAFLSHRAVRVCVSAEVRDAILETGRVNGPVFVIPNGIDFGELPAEQPHTADWLICGLKDGKSAVAKRLGQRLEAARGWGRVETLTKPLPRPEFLAAMARARRVVLLPRETEGFYLPAVEAMALGCLVICPDCVGNRSFCRDGFNAIVPANGGEDAVFAAMETAKRLGLEQETRLLKNARRLATGHTLERERAAFHEILVALPSQW